MRSLLASSTLIFAASLGIARVASAEPPAGAEPLDLFAEFRTIADRFRDAAKGPADPAYAKALAERDAAYTRLAARGEAAASPNRQVLADIYMTLGRYDDAARTLEVLIANPAYPETFWFRSRLVEALLGGDRVDDAAAALRAAVKSPVSSASVEKYLLHLPAALTRVVETLRAAERAKEADELLSLAETQWKAVEPLIGMLSKEERAPLSSKALVAALAALRDPGRPPAVSAAPAAPSRPPPTPTAPPPPEPPAAPAAPALTGIAAEHAAIVRAYVESGRGPSASTAEATRDADLTRLLERAEAAKDPDHGTMAAAYRVLRRPGDEARHLTALVAGDPSGISPRGRLTVALADAGRLDEALAAARETSRIPLDGKNAKEALASLPGALERLVDALVAAQRKTDAAEIVEAAAAQLKTLDAFLATLSKDRRATSFRIDSYEESIREARHKAKVQSLFHIRAIETYLGRFPLAPDSVGREATAERARTLALRRGAARAMAAEAEAARSTDHFGLLILYGEAHRPTEALREAEALLAEKKGKLFAYGHILSAFAMFDDPAPALAMFERWLAADVSPERFEDWVGPAVDGSFHGVRRLLDRLGRLDRIPEAEALLVRLATKVEGVKARSATAGKPGSATFKSAEDGLDEGRRTLEGWKVFRWAESWRPAAYTAPVGVENAIVRLKARRRLQAGPMDARPERDRAQALYEAGLEALVVAAEAGSSDRGELFSLYVDLGRADAAARQARLWSDEKPDDITRPLRASFALDRLQRPDDAKAMRHRALEVRPPTSDHRAYAADVPVRVRAMVLAAIERKDLAEAAEIARLFEAQLADFRSRLVAAGSGSAGAATSLEPATALAERLSRRVVRAGRTGAPRDFRDEHAEILFAFDEQKIHPKGAGYAEAVKARDAALARLAADAEAARWDGHDVLAAVHAGIGRHADSLRHADAWLASAPASLDARAARGLALVGMKRLDDARSAFAEASRVEPTLASAVEWLRAYPALASAVIDALLAEKRSRDASEAIETAAARLKALDTALAALPPGGRESLPSTGPFAKSLSRWRGTIATVDANAAGDLRKRLVEIRKAFSVAPRTIGRDTDADYQARISGGRAAAAALAKDAEREGSTQHEILMAIYGSANLPAETLREADAVLAARAGSFIEHSHVMEALAELSDLGPALAFVDRWIDAEVSWEQFVGWTNPLRSTSATGLGRIIDRLGDAGRDAEAVALLERAESRLARMRARFDAAPVKPAKVAITDFTGAAGFAKTGKEILDQWRTFRFHESSGPVAFATPIDIAKEHWRLVKRLDAQSRGKTSGPERDRARAVFLDGLGQLAAAAEPTSTQRGLLIILYRELDRPKDVLRQGTLWVEESPGELHPPASVSLSLDDLGLRAEAKAMRDRALAIEPAPGKVGTYLFHSRSFVEKMVDSAVSRRDHAEADDILRRYEMRIAALRTRPAAPGDDAKKLANAFKLSDDAIAAGKKRVALARRRESLLGTPYIPFEGPSWPNGGPPAPESLKGRVLVLLFWELRPKTLAFDTLERWRAELAGSGLTVVGVSTRERTTVTTLDDKKVVLHPARDLTPAQSDEELAKWAKHREIRMPLATVPSSTFAEAYGIDVLPSAVVVDRQGIVRTIVTGWRGSSVERLRAAILDALGLEPEPTAADAKPEDPEDE